MVHEAPTGYRNMFRNHEKVKEKKDVLTLVISTLQNMEIMNGKWRGRAERAPPQWKAAIFLHPTAAGMDHTCSTGSLLLIKALRTRPLPVANGGHE